MKPKINDKKINAVKMMREIRDILSNQYVNNPEKERKELEIIRKKYGITSQVKDKGV